MIGTKIEWATDTVNFWWGCVKVSPACEHCYAETLDARFNGGHWGKDAERKLKLGSAIRDLQKIARRAHKTGERPRVFVNSMSDFFEDRRDLDEARKIALLAMQHAPEVDFLLLTKRPEKIMELLVHALDGEMEKSCPISGFGEWLGNWIFAKGQAPRNIWLGTTVENQEWADKRIPALLEVPAAVRFLSCEPLLGPVLLDNGETSWLTCNGTEPYGEPCLTADETHGETHFHGIDWVIVGGESGAHARPMHPDWTRSLRDQCAQARVPFFYKQNGEWGAVDQPWAQDSPDDLAPNEQWLNRAGGQGFHGEQVWRMRRIGKKAAGRMLDGVEHNGMPEAHP